MNFSNFNICLLHGDDRDLISKHFMDMSQEDIYYRFGYHPSHETVLNYIHSISFVRDLVYGIKHDNKLIALAHVGFYSENDWTVGELGISIQSDYRRFGLGQKLILFIKDLAQKRQLTKLYINSVRTNIAMYQLMRKLNAELILDGQQLTLCLHLNKLNEHHQIPCNYYSGIKIFEKHHVNNIGNILFLHGSGGDAWQFRQFMMPYFSEKQINTSAIQLPYNKDYSDDTYSIIENCLNKLQSLNPLIPTVIIGHSTGAILAKNYCSQKKPNIQYLGLMSPVLFFSESHKQYLLNQVLEHMKCDISKKTFSQTIDSLPLSQLEQKLPNNSFLISGTHDQLIPIQYCKELSVIQNIPLHEFPTGHNLMISEQWKNISELISSYLKTNHAT